MLKLNFSEQNLEGWQIRNTFCLELIIYMLAHTFFLLSQNKVKGQRSKRKATVNLSHFSFQLYTTKKDILLKMSFSIKVAMTYSPTNLFTGSTIPAAIGHAQCGVVTPRGS